MLLFMPLLARHCHACHRRSDMILSTGWDDVRLC